MWVSGYCFLGVWFDSGDFIELSKGVWCILDEYGFEDVVIIVSNDLDE